MARRIWSCAAYTGCALNHENHEINERRHLKPLPSPQTRPGQVASERRHLSATAPSPWNTRVVLMMPLAGYALAGGFAWYERTRESGTRPYATPQPVRVLTAFRDLRRYPPGTDCGRGFVGLRQTLA